MDLQKLSQQAYATAKAHGWHDEKLPDETYLMLIITEIAEAVQADRKDRHADVESFNYYYEDNDDGFDADGFIFKAYYDDFIKNSVEDEIADIIIRCLDLLGLKKKGAYLDEYVSRYILDFMERKPSFAEFAYEMCQFAASGDDSLGISERIGCIIGMVLQYCKQHNIDIDFFVEQKMRFNKLRDYKHGNRKY